MARAKVNKSAQHARYRPTPPSPQELLWQTGVAGGIVFVNADADRLFWYAAENTEVGPFAANVPATRVIAGTKFLQCWGSRQNRIAESERIDVDGGGSPWEHNNGLTVTANAANRPNGDATADQLNHAAAGNSNSQQALSGAFDDDANIVASVYDKVSSGTEDWRFQLFGKFGAGTAILQTATTSWQRRYYSQDIGSGGVNPTISLRNASDALARSVLHATPQYEGGDGESIYYPGPPIRTGSTPKTKPGDLAYTDTPPSWLCAGKFDVQVFGDWVTSEVQDGDTHEVLHMDAFNFLRIKKGGGNLQAVMQSNGLQIGKVITLDSRQQIATLTVDFTAGSLTVAGATTGNGTVSNSSMLPWPIKRTYIGCDANGADNFNGGIGEPLRVAA
ncbi:MAG: hypothetical protein GWN84_20595 [Gammaproteobacteria bacterium]|nr:hypothetical protein [Gammaproteobacteria bacterium]NIR85161.1 hypothetical protein [Gammaproteobacteria bacterium]NIU06210.1 hypothetical protein [Gammaproteobacteria bacterium]NIX87483.1 hypothetical protein [Gammaproteobacteria bacterium]